jgi:rhamnose transport system substrate-binding protein
VAAIVSPHARLGRINRSVPAVRGRGRDQTGYPPKDRQPVLRRRESDRQGCRRIGSTVTRSDPLEGGPAGPVHQGPATQKVTDQSRPTTRTQSRPTSRPLWSRRSRSSASTEPGGRRYNVFVNQVDFSGVGVNLADWACELAPSCTGDIAILSAAATATNQNQWIDLMKKTLSTDAKYKGLKLVDTVYGDDKPDVSTTMAQGLLTKYPNLKVIVAPTTVGILAAAQVVSAAKKSDSVKVTGLGFPNDMKPFVADGTSPVFGLWSVPDLGYLAEQVAAKLVSGEIKGTEGETFSVKGLNGDKPYTIGKDSIVVLGPAFRFDKTNVNDFNF